MAGGIALANEVIFAPATGSGNPVSNINWRLVPATAALAFALGGLEKIEPAFAVGLAGLVVLSVLIIPVGKQPTPLQNLAKFVNPKA
jgi:hypothetical protein